MATKRRADPLHEHRARATSALGTGQVKQQHGPGSALNQEPDRRSVPSVADQLTLPASPVRGALRIRQLDTAGAAFAAVMLCRGTSALSASGQKREPPPADSGRDGPVGQPDLALPTSNLIIHLCQSR